MSVARREIVRTDTVADIAEHAGLKYRIEKFPYYEVPDAAVVAKVLDAFRAVVANPRTRDLPMILETPNDLAGYKREIALLRGLAADVEE